MRIIYYTYPYFFDASLCFIRSMSKKVDMHVIMEVTPENRKGPLFDLTSTSLDAGIADANTVLHEMLPVGAERYWSDLRGFHLNVYDSRHIIHPSTFIQGKKLGQLIYEIGPDILLFDDLSLRIALGSPFFRNVSWMIGIHDPESHSGEMDWRSPISRKLMYGRAKQFILHNKKQEKRFLEKYHIPPGRATIIPLGIYDVYQNWISQQEAEDNSILFFGRFSYYKGIEVLFDAAVQVCRELENVKFNIVGGAFSGYQLPRLPLLSRGGSINLVMQYVTTYELAQFFSKAVCIVCPYLDATQSGVVLTAYAFQKPVIATNVGGLPEYVIDDKTGLLVEPNDPKMLAAAIIRLLNEKELQNKLKNGISSGQLQWLNWDEISNRYLEIFNKVAKNE
jgi:glycosyltransferase involved in cell wall biosynthesis